MCFNLPFKNTGASTDDYLFQLVEKLNATEFGAYSVFKEVEKAIDSDKVPDEKKDKSVMAGYEALKDLVIKTGDYAIKNSETFEKTFSGSYLTVSEFGTYKEQMENRITADESGITQLYTYTSELDGRATTLEGETSDLDDRATTLEEDTEGINNSNGKWSTATKQYVKTGLLYYENGLPVYGVGVGVLDTTVSHGETVVDMANSELLTHTANEIGFWQGGDKVAYIRAKKLYLPDAEILGGSININDRFIVDSLGNVTATGLSIGTSQVTGLSGFVEGKITAADISADQITAGTIYSNGNDITTYNDFYGIITIDEATYKSRISATDTATIFSYHSNRWNIKSGSTYTPVTLSDYGITVSGTYVNENYFAIIVWPSAVNRTNFDLYNGKLTLNLGTVSGFGTKLELDQNGMRYIWNNEVFGKIEGFKISNNGGVSRRTVIDFEEGDFDNVNSDFVDSSHFRLYSSDGTMIGGFVDEDDEADLWLVNNHGDGYFRADVTCKGIEFEAITGERIKINLEGLRGEGGPSIYFGDGTGTYPIAAIDNGNRYLYAEYLYVNGNRYVPTLMNGKYVLARA